MKRPRGQVSLVLVIGLLALAIGMYTTYTISRTVYEKVRLQNAVDATAYSIATREARAFNFAAFANRTQIASYAQLLEYHGAYSNALFQASMLGFWGDVMQSLGKQMNLPTLISVGLGMQTAYDALMVTINTVIEPALVVFTKRTDVLNTAFFVLSAAMVMSAAAQAADGDIEMAHRNDPQANANDLTTLLNGINAAQLGLALDPGSFAPELTNNESKLRAQRLIAELANGSRYGNEVAANIVDRQMNSWVGTELSIVGAQLGAFSSVQTLNKFNVAITSMDNLLSDGAQYVGTTKLVADAGDLGSTPPLEQTATARADNSYLNPGTVVMSKDTYAGGRLPTTGVASVTSTSQGSTVCTYNRNTVQGYGQAYHWTTLAEHPTAQGFECTKKTGLTLSGIGRYIGYGAPRTSSVSTSAPSTFRQPDVWMFLTKSPTSFQLSGSGDLRFTISRGSQQASLDTRPKSLTGGILEGMSALARAQVYYHRPGAWQEPPNLFNPYWGVRLAPKREALDQLAEQAGLSGAFLDLVDDNVTMF